MHAFFHSLLLAFSEASETDKRQLIRLTLCLAALVNCSFALVSGGQPSLDGIYLGGLVAFIGLWVISYMGLSNNLLLQGLIATSMICGLNVCLATGGIHSPSLMWLVFLPNLALFFSTQRATLIWVVLLVCMLVLICIATIENMGQLSESLATLPSTWTVLNLLMAQCIFMLVHLIYDAQYREKSGRMAKSMKRMKQVKKHLQLTESYKDRFISTVSEELRSPMNAILGYSDVLVELAQKRPALAETSRHIRNSILQLLEMTNNILDHAQLHEAKLQLHFRAVAIQQLIKAEWSGVMVKDKVQFRVEVQQDMPQWLWCDPDRLKQIVNILVSNAKKFTLHGEIVLKWSYQSKILKIDVIDTGIGISEEVKQHIFKRFDKSDEKINREFGGIGLGLANAQELTKLFGGTMGFASETQKGSHFWVCLPITAYATNTQPSPIDNDLSQLANARILVVDDHAVSMMVTMQTLRKALPKADLMHASSGAKAMELLRKHPMDLVLMDVLMPHMDGPNTCRMIREDLGLGSTQLVIVGLTSSTHAKDRERCFESGMNDVITKPIEPHHFIKVLASQMKRRSDAGQPKRLVTKAMA